MSEHDYHALENGELSGVDRVEPVDRPDPLTHRLVAGDLLQREVDAAADLLARTRSEATRRAYRGQWQRFTAWCEARGLVALPARPEAVVAYMGALVTKGRRVSSINQALSAISVAHTLAGHESPRGHPLVRDAFRGARRKLGVAPQQKAPLMVEQLRRMREHLRDPPAGTRDWALASFGLAGAMRRCELAALELRHLAFVDRGLEVVIERSKTDQEGKGRLVVIARGDDEHLCPVRALRAWLQAAKIERGPIFRPVDRFGRVRERALSGHGIAYVLKQMAQRAGLEPDHIGGHSLRAGFVTEATNGGADLRSIMNQTGHRSVQVVQTYQRRRDQWERPASERLGL